MRPIGVGMLGSGFIGELPTHGLRYVPDEAHARSHDAMMAGVVDSLRAGTSPRETFEDGYGANAILDAACRSVECGCREPVRVDAELLEPAR